MIFAMTLGSLSNHDDLGDNDGRYARRDWTEDFVLGGKMKLKQRSCSRTTTFDIFVQPRICQEMTSFRDVQNLCLLSHGFNFIDDMELLILYDMFEPRNPDFPYESYAEFDLDEMVESECLAEFRFKKRDVYRLADVLQIPQTLRCDQRSTCGGVEGLCMLLRRLSYPCRYGDMIHRFAKPVPVISMVTNNLIDYIFDVHGRRLTHWNPEILDPDHLETYAAAITARGSPLHNCFGFIDGTVRPIARPGDNQRILYNGHKRVHAIKFQSFVLPNGLIGNMYGPVGELCSYIFVIAISNKKNCLLK